MPTYVYKFVDSGETIEVHQDFRDDTLTEIAHPGSGEMLPVKKVFTPVGVTFKGSGFFKTDNRGKKPSMSSSSGESSKGSESNHAGSNGSGSSSSGSSSSDSSSTPKSDSSTPKKTDSSSGSSSTSSTGSSSPS